MERIKVVALRLFFEIVGTKTLLCRPDRVLAENLLYGFAPCCNGVPYGNNPYVRKRKSRVWLFLSVNNYGVHWCSVTTVCDSLRRLQDNKQTPKNGNFSLLDVSRDGLQRPTQEYVQSSDFYWINNKSVYWLPLSTYSLEQESSREFVRLDTCGKQTKYYRNDACAHLKEPRTWASVPLILSATQ